MAEPFSAINHKLSDHQNVLSFSSDSVEPKTKLTDENIVD